MITDTTRIRATTRGLALALLALGLLPVADAASRSRRSTNTPEPAPAAAPANAAPLTYDAFRLVADRNIFNPNRFPRSSRSSGEEARPASDTIAFVGTMQSEKGIVAFFDSPDGRYRKVLPPGGKLGDFAVGKITNNTVELTREQKQFALRITQQLQRSEAGEWSVSDVNVGRVGPGPGDRGANPAAPPPIPANASDALRRLMEQRQKQLRQ
jgi:hypothetical protein